MCSSLRGPTRVIAYSGMDIEIKESGLWKGKATLSKRGSGFLRRVLSMTALRCIHREDSAFGVSYQRLVECGLKTGSALMAVMRKLLAVAAHLLMHEGEEYDRSLVCGSRGFACRTLQDVALKPKEGNLFLSFRKLSRWSG
jgi:transposase